MLELKRPIGFGKIPLLFHINNNERIKQINNK